MCRCDNHLIGLFDEVQKGCKVPFSRFSKGNARRRKRLAWREEIPLACEHDYARGYLLD